MRLHFKAAIFAMSLAAQASADSFPHDVPQMVEQAESAGIVHQYTGPWEYFVGGGVASFDCNGDRMPDLFVAGGTSEAKLFVNRSTPGGMLSFSPQPLSGPTKKIIGAYPINIDNDAYTDLVILRLGRNLILKGGPECSFTDASDVFGFDGGSAWTTAFAATWEADQTYPTLAFGNYVDRQAEGSPWGTCHDNRLLRAEGDVAPNYADPTPLTPGYCALSMLFTDWDNSGTPALRITNDRQYHIDGQEQLWDLSSSDRVRRFTAQDGWRKLVIWGMGIAEHDVTGNGRPDYALSSMGDTMLQSLDDEADPGAPAYRDVAFDLGATAHRPYMGDNSRPSTGWHTQFADVNNDARIDLFIAKGNVEQMTDFAAFDPDNLLMGQQDKSFSEQGEAAGIALDRRGRGAVVEDLNADGMLDLVVVNREAPVSVFRNAGVKTDWGHRSMGNFLSIELSQSGQNTDAIGALVTVKTGNLVQTRTRQVGGGHVSGQLGFTHFGLGVAERAEVRVTWPDGTRSKPIRAFANSFLVIERDQDTPMMWYPPED